MADELRRVVKSPDGRRYEVVGSVRDWRLGTGSLLLDAAAFVWAALRQARGKEWVVSVRRADSGTSPPFIRRLVKTESDAGVTVAELAVALENGQLSLPA